MKPLSLQCDANPNDHATLSRAGACAGLTVQEGRKIALANLTAPQMREAAAWLNECAAEVEAMRCGPLASASFPPAAQSLSSWTCFPGMTMPPRIDSEGPCVGLGCVLRGRLARGTALTIERPLRRPEGMGENE